MTRSRRLSRDLAVVVLCLLTVSSVAFPATAMVGPDERDPRLERVSTLVEDRSPAATHATAIAVLGGSPAEPAPTDAVPSDRLPDAQPRPATPVDHSLFELMRAEADYESYRSDARPRLARDHARSVRLLRAHADRSPGFDSRLNTSTALLVRGDRTLAEQSVADARQTLRAHRSLMTAAERRQVETRLDRAASLLDTARTASAARTTGGMLSDRAETLDTVARAWALSDRAEDEVYQLSQTSIRITSRGDPLRNGSGTATRNITGIVEGADPEDIDQVTVTVNGNQTTTATVTEANSARFSAPVTISSRVATVRASVTVSPSGESARAGGSGGGLTRQIPVGAATGTGRAYLSPGSSTARVSFEDGLTARSVTVNASVSPTSTVGQVRALQFETIPEGYPTPTGTVETGVDVSVRPNAQIAGSNGSVSMRLDRARLATTEPSTLQLRQYDGEADQWVTLPTERTADAETVTLRARTDDVTALFVAVSDTASTATDTATEADRPTATPAAPAGTPPGSTPAPDAGDERQSDTEPREPASETGDSGGVIDSLVEGIERVFDELTSVFGTTVSPVDVASAERQSLAPGDAPAQAQSSTTRSAVLFLDGDGLPDTYETAVLGSSPLDPRSDFATTPADESTAPLSDGAKDPDNDTVLNTAEAALGTDPLDNNTDGDALADGVETRLSQFNATAADTDGDGRIDGRGDPDGDGLETRTELAGTTSPTEADSDDDGLIDSEELQPSVPVPATDPTTADTDGDGLDDSVERDLGTDPTDNDTDDDGVLDGAETFETRTANASAGVSVEIAGPGNVADSVEIATDNAPIFNTTSVNRARASDVVSIDTERNFTAANVSISYDPDRASDPSKLAVYRLNRSAGSFQPLDSMVDTRNETVTATTSQFSRFAVFDVPAWESNFETVTPPNVGDDPAIAPVDAALVIDSSGSMGVNDPQDIRKQAARDFTGALVENLDRASVVDFDGNAVIRQSLTFDFQAANRSIDSIDSFGGTNIGAGVAAANREFRRNSNESRAKIAILLTDGRGGGGVSQARTAAEQNVTIFTIGLSRAADSSKLRQIADETGGNFTQVSRADDLPQIFSRIANSTSADTDGDGLSDATEIGGLRLVGGAVPVNAEPIRTDPFDADTDGDGIPDGVEAGQRRTTQEEVTVQTRGGGRREITSTRTVFEARSDPTDLDTDDDGLSDARESGTYTVRFTSSAEATDSFERITDLSNTVDLDLDDVRSELTTRQVSPDPRSPDTDEDGLGDATEMQIGTDPTSNDTDGDLIPDSREVNLSDSDPTLFDNSRPEITVETLRLKTVGNRIGGPIDVFDVKYIVEYEVRDPAGVASVTIKRGGRIATDTFTDFGTRGEPSESGRLTVVAESFLAQTQQLILGERIEIQAVDTNGNGGDGFATKTNANVYKQAVKEVGDLFPQTFPFPVLALSILRGFADDLLGQLQGIKSAFDLVVRLVDPTRGGVVEQVLGQLQTAGRTLLQAPLEFVELYLRTYQTDMRGANPFELPDQFSNVLDELATRLSDAVGLSNADLARGISDHSSFGVGYYLGVVGSSLVATIISGGVGTLTVLGGRIGQLFRVADKIIDGLKAVESVSSALTGGITSIGAIGSRVATVSRATRALEQIDRFPAEAVAFGLAGVSRVKAVVVFDLIDDRLATDLGSALSLITSNVADVGPERFVSQYLAATGADGARALNAVESVQPSAAAALLRPATTGLTDRIVASELASGDVTARTASEALSVIQSEDAGRTAALDETIRQGGAAGIRYLAATSGASTAERVDLVGSASVNDFTVEELSALARASSGEQVSRALEDLGLNGMIRLLSLDAGSATVAQANVVRALDAGTVNETEVAVFLASVNAASPQQRQQRINSLSLATNATESARVVTS